MPREVHERLEACWQRVKRDFFPYWKSGDWTCEVLHDQVFEKLREAERAVGKVTGDRLPLPEMMCVYPHRKIYARASLVTTSSDNVLDSVMIHEICHALLRVRRKRGHCLAWHLRLEKVYQKVCKLKRNELAELIDYQLRQYSDEVYSTSDLQMDRELKAPKKRP